MVQISAVTPGSAAKKSWFLILLRTLGRAGCSSEYLIATTNGRIITTDEKPRLDRDTGMLEFEDSEGRTQQIPQAQVKQIIERRGSSDLEPLPRSGGVSFLPPWHIACLNSHDDTRANGGAG